jgi:hypothetical protein
VYSIFEQGLKPADAKAAILKVLRSGRARKADTQ